MYTFTANPEYLICSCYGLLDGKPALRCTLRDISCVSPEIIQGCCADAKQPVPLLADYVIQASSKALILKNKVFVTQDVSCLLHTAALT